MTEPDPGGLRDELAQTICGHDDDGPACTYGGSIADAIMPIVERHVTAAEAKGVARERARVLRLLEDRATVEKIKDWQEEHTDGHVYGELIGKVLDALHALIGGDPDYHQPGPCPCACHAGAILHTDADCEAGDQ